MMKLFLNLGFIPKLLMLISLHALADFDEKGFHDLMTLKSSIYA